MPSIVHAFLCSTPLKFIMTLALLSAFGNPNPVIRFQPLRRYDNPILAAFVMATRFDLWHLKRVNLENWE